MWKSIVAIGIGAMPWSAAVGVHLDGSVAMTLAGIATMTRLQGRGIIPNEG